jgi:hypothetical protein
VTELALDDDHWDALTRQLNGVRVAKLVRSEPPAHPGARGEPMQMRPSAGCRPLSPGRGSTDHAEERTEWESFAVLAPGPQQLPAPAIHADLATLAALAAADENRSTRRVQVALGQRQGLADP